VIKRADGARITYDGLAAMYEAGQARIRELESLVPLKGGVPIAQYLLLNQLATIPPNYSEHMKSCVCAWCEKTATLLDGFASAKS
jgi:hypothetical protein